MWSRRPITCLATVFQGRFPCAALQTADRRVPTPLILVYQMVFVKIYSRIKRPSNRTQITGGKDVAIVGGAANIACRESAPLLP
jgi:hypothetical protein